MRNRQKNNILGELFSSNLDARSYLVFIVYGFCLLILSGCVINVGGRDRSLLSHGRIKGEVELSAAKSINDQGDRRGEMLVFEERIRLQTEGDFYHPSFLTYSVMFGAGLIQQDFESETFSDSSSGQTEEYNLSMDILRGKSYPMKVYADKSKAVLPREFFEPLEVETSGAGASISLRSEFLPMSFSYGESQITQDSLSSNSASGGSDFSKQNQKHIDYNVSHRFSDYSNLRFQLQQSDTTSKTRFSESSNTNNTYILDHQQAFGPDNLYSLDSLLRQEDNHNTTDVERRFWSERLTLRHSENFTTNYEFRHNETEQASFRNKETNWRGSFQHRLYESLNTTGSVFFEESDFGTGVDAERKGYDLNFNYIKKNPWGYMSSIFGTSFTQTDTKGGTGGVGIVTDEVHFATLEPVELVRRNIDTTTLFVKDGSGNLYTEGEDYLVSELNGRIRLEILLFGGNFPDFTTLNGTEKFFVDYQFLIEPESQAKVTSNHFRILQSFDNGFGIYYQFRQTKEDISSNNAAISPDESRTDIYGLTYTKNRLSLRSVYSDDRSTFVRTNRTLIEGDYQFNITRETNLTLRASREFLNTEKPTRSEVDIMRLGGVLNSQLTSRHDLSLRMDYYTYEVDGGNRTEGVALGSLLRYKYRQLSAQIGATYNLLDHSLNRTENIYYFVRVIRKF